MDVEELVLAALGCQNMINYAEKMKQKNNATIVAIHLDPGNNFVLGHSYIVLRNSWEYVVVHNKDIKNPSTLGEMTIPCAEIRDLSSQSTPYKLLAPVIGEYTLAEILAHEQHMDLLEKAKLN